MEGNPALATTAPTTPLSRRGLLAAGGALGLTALLAACGSDSADSGSGGGSWSFTDDRGKKAETDGRPEKIVAFVSSAAALHDYGVTCTAIFGPSEPVGGRPNPQAGDLDLAELESLGEAWGEFNVEKYASLRPDLLVAGMYQENTLWYVPEESAEAVGQIAPSVGVQLSGKPLVEIIERYGELAAALGADPDAPPVAEARARFEAAGAALKTLAAARPDLKVMVVTATPDALYVAYMPDHPDITYWSGLGLGIVSPERPTESEGGFWEVLSWENADKYAADVIGLPAVKAGQVYPWHAAERYSHLGYAQVMEELKGHLEGARDDVVE